MVKVGAPATDHQKMSVYARHEPESLLTLPQVAQMARVDLLVVTDAVRDKKLSAHQERGDWMVRVSDMRRWLARR